jgi:hypothetical protein
MNSLTTCRTTRGQLTFDPSMEKITAPATKTQHLFMFHRFEYEAEFYPTLSRLPLYVRMKLDITGIKLTLKDWLAFSIEERQAICHLPADNAEEQEAFTAYVDFLRRRYHASPAERLPPMSGSLWNPDRVPQPVLDKSHTNGKVVTLQEWRQWKFHERYALYKTAISKSEPETFYAVLNELRVRLTDRRDHHGESKI